MDDADKRVVTKPIPPDALWPAGREGAAHEAISELWTACGRMIGTGWLNTTRPVDCKKCLRGTYSVKPEVAIAAATMGTIGGKAGKGEAKRRGDSDYYRALRAKRTAKAKGNASA